MRVERLKSADNCNWRMVQPEQRISSSRCWLQHNIAPRNSPMLLVIDAGNTNITLGVFQGTDLVAQWRLTTEDCRTGDEYGVQARNLFEFAGIDYKDINAIVIASVVPLLHQALQQMSEVYFQLT